MKKFVLYAILALCLLVTAGCSKDEAETLQETRQVLDKDGYRMLSGPEIVEALSGNTIKGISHEKKYTVYFYDAERNVGIWDEQTDEGSWSVRGDEYGQTWKNWADGKTRYMKVAVKDDSIRLIRNGEIYRQATIFKGNVDDF